MVKEKEGEAEGQAYINLFPCDFFFFYAFCTKTRQCQKYDGKEFCPQDGCEQSGCAVEIEEDFIDYVDVDTPVNHGLVTKLVNVDGTK